MGAGRGAPRLGELRLGMETLEPAACSRMGNRTVGTGMRGGRGKPRPLQAVGKLRSGNLESAAGREPSPLGLDGIKPSSGSNPEGGSSRAARPGEDRPVQTRCGDAKPQESHRGQSQSARRPVRRLEGQAQSYEGRRSGRAKSGTHEGGVGTSQDATRSVSRGESRRKRDDDSYHNPWKPG